MNKEELINKLYEKAYKKAPRPMFGTYSGYYHISPKPLNMDNGTVVNVEWVQPSYWSKDVLINYKTDCLKTTRLSEKELTQLLAII
jgi:hypothetical protein